MKQISLIYLRELLSYDPFTGALTWLERPREHFKDIRSFTRWKNRYAGTVASHVGARGYIIVHINGQNYLGHRIAWALHFGGWPDGQVDHINGIRSDNRIANIRTVDWIENARNTCIARNNKSGVTGVCWTPSWGCWMAHIGVAGKNIQLGRFKTRADAIRARKAAERRYGFHPNHGRAA
jgi:hypothetical protein